MRIRAFSSVGVVIIGIVPAILGGPVLAVLMTVLGILAYFEFRSLGTRLAGPGAVATSGYPVVAAFSFAPLLDRGAGLVVAITVAAVSVPLVAALRHPAGLGSFVGWAITSAGSLYIGLPLYGAVALRSSAGSVDTEWLTSLANAAAISWDGNARGLAWLVIVFVATWLGDTMAYLAGRRWGRRPLLPHVSPNKTVEGSLAGLVASSTTAAVGVVLFGLGVDVWVGALVGLVLGVVGQLGDLSESMLKRQAGVKDSGDLIPGHGGVLDRIDALLFALPSGWLLTAFIDRAIG